MIDERLRAGTGDRAKVLNQIFTVHPDTVVRDRQAPPLLVDAQGDAKLGIVFRELGVSEDQIAQPIASVRGVRDELAKKDFLFAVERIGNDVEQAAYLRLKGKCLFPP